MDRPLAFAVLALILLLAAGIVGAPFLLLGVPAPPPPPVFVYQADAATAEVSPRAVQDTPPSSSSAPSEPTRPPVPGGGDAPPLHVSPEGDYSVRFPAKPTPTTSTRMSLGEEIAVRADMAFLDKVVYTVRVEEHAPRILEGDLVLAEVASYLMPDSWGTTRQAGIALDGHAGIEVESVAQGLSGRHHRIDRVFAVGTRLYDVFVFGREDVYDPAAARRFVESFALGSLPSIETLAAESEPQAGGAELDWRIHDDAEGRFAVELPGTGRKTERTLIVAGEALPFFYTGATQPWGVFGVSYCDYPVHALRGRPSDELLEAFVSSLVDDQGDQLEMQYVWIQDRAGRDFVYDGQGVDGPAVYHTRVLMDDYRLYLLQAIGDPAHLREADVEHFFQSFRLVPVPDRSR